MTAYIYGLVDPNDGQLKYVGKTIDPKTRLDIHLRRAKKNRAKTWFRQLLKAKKKPQLYIIDQVEYTEETTHLWKDLERFYIQYMKFVGCPLINKHPGGSGG